MASLSSVRIVLALVALICDLSFLHMLNLVGQFVIIYILILICKLPNISTDARLPAGPGTWPAGTCDAMIGPGGRRHESGKEAVRRSGLADVDRALR
jgi:hypothetical protein